MRLDDTGNQRSQDDCGQHHVDPVPCAREADEQHRHARHRRRDQDEEAALHERGSVTRSRFAQHTPIVDNGAGTPRKDSK